VFPGQDRQRLRIAQQRREVARLPRLDGHPRVVAQARDRYRLGRVAQAFSRRDDECAAGPPAARERRV
jgi:hypothetical protein